MELLYTTIKHLSDICLAQSILCEEQEVVDGLTDAGMYMKELDNLMQLSLPHIWKAQYKGVHEQDRIDAKELYERFMKMATDDEESSEEGEGND